MCGGLFGNQGAAKNHEIHCRHDLVVEHEAIADANSTRSLFDWEDWARRFAESEDDRFASQAAANSPAAVQAEVDKEVDNNEEADLFDDGDAMDVDEPAYEPLLDAIKEKKLRHRFKLSLKIELLNQISLIRSALARRSGVAEGTITVNRIIEVVHRNSGVAKKTFDKWTRKEETLRIAFLDKFNRKRENFGSGRKARFPKAEGVVAEVVRSRRRLHLVVSKGFIIRELTSEAKKENKDLLAKHPITDDIFFGFLWRHKFSFRKPSNVKTLTKAESMKRIRGFWKWLIKLLKGEIPIALGESNQILPKFGRFPPKSRLNSDEVPGRFGGTDSIVSIQGEGSTILRVLEGWGDRICTWRLTAGPGGFALPVGVIFKGTGLKLTEDELNYYKSLPNIVVLFQANAWVDTTIELKLVELMMKKIVLYKKAEFTAAGEPFPGLLMLVDNFKPHFAPYKTSLFRFSPCILDLFSFLVPSSMR